MNGSICAEFGIAEPFLQFHARSRKSALCSLNYRLTPDDFVYLINHSGSRMVCADRDYLGAIDNIRKQLPKVEHLVAQVHALTI
jgi:hypothetical protein